MGKSITINVIGLGPELEPGRRRAFYAMNKMEMLQEKAKAARDYNTEIIGWYAQTGTGARMIGVSGTFEEVPDSDIKHIKLVECPICQGKGKTKLGNGMFYGCVVCNASGITKAGYWKGWQDWQLEEMSNNFKEA